MPREPRPTFDPAYIRDISEAVYRHQLGAEDTQRMIEKDEDQGQKLRNRAGSYDQLTRAYLKALGFDPSSHPEGERQSPSLEQYKNDWRRVIVMFFDNHIHTDSLDRIIELAEFNGLFDPIKAAAAQSSTQSLRQEG